MNLLWGGQGQGPLLHCAYGCNLEQNHEFMELVLKEQNHNWMISIIRTTEILLPTLYQGILSTIASFRWIIHYLCWEEETGLQMECFNHSQIFGLGILKKINGKKLEICCLLDCPMLRQWLKLARASYPIVIIDNWKELYPWVW